MFIREINVVHLCARYSTLLTLVSACGSTCSNTVSPAHTETREAEAVCRQYPAGQLQRPCTGEPSYVGRDAAEVAVGAQCLFVGYHRQ